MAVTEPAPDGTLPPGPLFRLISDQRVAFVIVGVFNTVNAFVIFVIAHHILGSGFRGYMLSLLISHVIAVMCAFTLHRRFVFRVRGHVWLDLARFELVNLAALGVNAVLLPLFVEVGGLPVIPSQVLAGGLAVIGTYFGHLLFSFRRPEISPEVSTAAVSEAIDS
jgi:putative flippase GtrA